MKHNQPSETTTTKVATPETPVRKGYVPEIVAIAASLFGFWVSIFKLGGMTVGGYIMLVLVVVSVAKLIVKGNRNRGILARRKFER
jgi:hypothetical protein